MHWVESSDLEPASASASSDGGAGSDDVAASAEKRSAAWAVLESSDGVVVPGGFGNRGVEGKIATARHCREANKPPSSLSRMEAVGYSSSSRGRPAS